MEHTDIGIQHEFVRQHEWLIAAYLFISCTTSRKIITFFAAQNVIEPVERKKEKKNRNSYVRESRIRM